MAPAAERKQTKGRADIWRDALGEEEPPPVGRTLDLNSDEPEAVIRLDEDWTSDPLGIRPDVASFATLLASKSLEPPLSIGLFGPWGSGKTTFLKRLRYTIDERTKQAKASRAAQQETPYVANVVHVEFNAWHFAEDALISSLVDTIVRELRAFIKDDYPVVGTALANLKSETVEHARRKVELAKRNGATARQTVATAKNALSGGEEEARKKAVSLNTTIETIWKATVEAVDKDPAVIESGVIERVGNTVKNLDELQTQLNAIRARPARLLSELGWVRTLLFAGMVIALPILASWLVSRLFENGLVLSGVASLGTLLTAVVVWLRFASEAVGKVDKAITKVVQTYENKINNDPDVKSAQERLRVAKVAAAQHAETLAEAERTLRKAEAEADEAALPKQMLMLVSGRVEDMSYAKELTTISVARGDLQTPAGSCETRGMLHRTPPAV